MICKHRLLLFENATQVAIKAGYSQKMAYRIGDENLGKPEIKSYIEKRMEELKSQRIARCA
ncbi:terminase small subunit [Lysinibacillus sp. JNUCC 51]|nr:terminase small subunit [Lysinibacillus sp. JNUCC-51]